VRSRPRRRTRRRGNPSPRRTCATAASPAPGEKKEGDKAAAEKAPTEDEARAAAQTAWREKLTQAQSDVTNWTGEVTRIQAALNDMTGPLYGCGRAARADSLENAKRQLAAAQTTLQNLQDEGRLKRYQ
jgi:hypothetical protein